MECPNCHATNVEGFRQCVVCGLSVLERNTTPSTPLPDTGSRRKARLRAGISTRTLGILFAIPLVILGFVLLWPLAILLLLVLAVVGVAVAVAGGIAFPIVLVDMLKAIGSKKITTSQWSLAGLIAAVAAGMLLYSLVVENGLKESSALFIGGPAIVAIVLTLTPRAKSATGMIVKVITIALVASGVFFQEGAICIAMAAPLFYLVGIAIGKTYDRVRSGAGSRRNSGFNLLIALPFLLMSLEGTHENLSFPRDETVTAKKIVRATMVDVETALSKELRLDQELPRFLRLGFPIPVATDGGGLEPGSRRTVTFAGGPQQTGQLILEVTDRTANSVRYQVVSDDSKIADWLDWKEAEVRWTGLESGNTLVAWTLRYERRLDPAWYFGPLERYAVKLSAEYLVEALATP